MNRLLLIIVVCAALSLPLPSAAAAHIVGGDISLVPAYEAAGDVWLDADGQAINTSYSDGMITYLRDVAQWNALRVRLLVDPSVDSDVSTCQDLQYVAALGRRIKAAGLSFLLDIFYSDTWTDVSQQWIPTAWGMDKDTATATIAAMVGDYTREVLTTLVESEAAPDYVQIGNEVTYGMLWDTYARQDYTQNIFYLYSSYSAYERQITRFASLLGAAAEAVRAVVPTAKIILHSERTHLAEQTINFYTWVAQAGFSDYDIIGLSYYPMWQGTLTTLRSSLSSITAAFPDKEVHIVETAYYNNSDVGDTTNCSWELSFAGQAAFLRDLIAVLNDFESVTGLYYWCPEECGNSAKNGTAQVMGSWLNRGFWALTWETGTHSLGGSAAIEAMKTFLTNSAEGIATLPTSPSAAAAEGIYTLQGTRVASCHRKGIYIVDGKKKIVE